MFNQKVYRITNAANRAAGKTGVFIYCEQHAREWVGGITCLETAQRLVTNYATDPTTKSYGVGVSTPAEVKARLDAEPAGTPILTCRDAEREGTPFLIFRDDARAAHPRAGRDDDDRPAPRA